MQDLADGFAADGGLDGVLHIGDVNAETVGGGAVDVEIDVGLAADLECAEVGDAGDLAHHALRSGRPFSSSVFRSWPNSFTASSPFTPLTASSTLSEIGCEKFQIDAGELLELSDPWRR